MWSPYEINLDDKKIKNLSKEEKIIFTETFKNIVKFSGINIRVYEKVPENLPFHLRVRKDSKWVNLF